MIPCALEWCCIFLWNKVFLLNQIPNKCSYLQSIPNTQLPLTDFEELPLFPSSVSPKFNTIFLSCSISWSVMCCLWDLWIMFVITLKAAIFLDLEGVLEVPKCVSSARLDSSALMDPAFGRMFILWHLNTEGWGSALKVEVEEMLLL